MITINNVNYKSIYEVCVAYGINYHEVEIYKIMNKGISEFDILAHFIPNMAIRMDTGAYITNQSTQNDRVRL